MSSKKILIVLGTLLVVAVFITACAGPQGEQGPPGPAGPAGPQGEPGPTASTTDLTCTQCHNDTALISSKRASWQESLHGSGTAFIEEGGNQTCAFCHSGATFSASVAAHQNFTQVESGDANPTHQDCRTCHQIHTTYTEADWALETTDPVAFVVSGLTYDGGAGNLCANCHQARRYLANFKDKTDATKYTSTSPRFNPHLSVQGDILMGSGGFGVEGKPGSHYAMVKDTCVGCHMGDSRNHRMEAQITTCQTCHADATSYDVNGAVTKIDARIEELKAALTAKGLLDADGAVVPGTWDEKTATALWNYGVIEEDASHGVHNPNYINALLDASFVALGE
ncbi:MAG: hypothetical protein QM730_14820 [Anaerolineales bacterium]